MASGRIQRIHGVRLAGELEVPGAARAQDGAPDFVVAVAPPAPLGSAQLRGEVVAALEFEDAGYTATVRDRVLTVRFNNVAEFEVDRKARSIVAHPEPGAAEEMVPLLLAGNVLAIVLGLEGVTVLHASTVEVGGRGVAFAGPSAAGKSTAAALACAAGAALVGDDTARLDESSAALGVHQGSAEIRLRTRAAPLAERLGERRPTADGRVAASVTPARAPVTELAAIVVPRWSAERDAPAAAELGARDALEALLRAPRVAGWRVEDPVRAHFRSCARIAERLPAYELVLPQRTLLDEGLPKAVHDVLADAGALPDADPAGR